MEKSDLQKLIQIRETVIRYYNTLDGRTANPSTAQMRQVDAARSYEHIIQLLDECLSASGVKFE